ncbi:hypothetical protein AAG570_000450 [Ranatra chinensis]|uniref:Uncharacterized protein n=1 Tax=Ranatra chinensis TaxID=642074 RepID=A0ABD0YX34_9HEMI
MLKMKMHSDVESDGESDDSQKLSMVVDDNNEENVKEAAANDDIPLAGDDVAAMALTLDDKVNNVKVQSVVKECVRTSCMSCNYCRHAVKIAVNGKQLGLHLLSEHRYTPVKNETSDDVIRKIKVCLDELNTMYFNTETYDSSDPSIHIPYDKDNNFDCFQCNYVTNSHRDLYAHKRKSHTKSLLLCIMCKSNFYSYSELLCHLCPGTYNAEIQFQNADINFRCCFCRLDTIPSAFRLMVHLRKCHHTCDICLEVCLDQQKLSTHMWKHKLNHLCYRCGIAYASKPDITKHLFWKHGTESVLCKKCLQKKWPHVYHFCIPPTSFICEECNTSFSKAVALKVHKRIHAGDFSYPCSLCEKRFISQKLLSRHEDRHKNIIENKENNLNKTNDTVDCKEEIINHKKDKEKEKKSKQVVDVYDLPPLNLSSESDSSDEEEMQKKNCASNEEKSPVAEGEVPDLEDPSKVPVLDDAPNPSDGLLQSENSGEDVAPRDDINAVDSVPGTSVDPVDTNKSEDVYNESNKALEGIWENFYKTSSQNKSLPYPLCAMKSEVAYGIIMGDHDYCQQYKSEPVINEDIPTSNIDLNLSDNKDSSSDSDSSSCSCGTNCSCSSCSSNSSSSSSSDSDSSSTEGRLKQERRRKRKERRLKPKEETTIEAPKEPVPMETENEPPPEPEDPPIRESELETDETSTDEEFYDRHPQRIANQLLAEKRNRLMLLASVAPVNNGTSSPTQTQAEITTAQKSPPVPATPTVKQKQKASTPQREYQESSHPAAKQYKSSDLKSLPHSDTPGSGSETESMRSSKRRRIPNKFYGYSSGEEEDSKPVAPPAVKWRKQDLPAQSPKRQILPPPPPTPRIQLTTPKQVINRKQINNPPKPRSDSSSNDSDSSDDEDSVPPHSGQQETQKTDVYCYCRCPYDEVSEMIACDDSHCKIEWFHFECVGILVPPRGQWFCPECRKKRGLPT